ncbi:hypothetical protein C488_14712 [Natrinema pellirubrum DSM 15624]|uniref:Uncharacterized protein n=1 Tax=Natrinema pellirubrum (strain DSM 15624 / CIP 106293 / JCM 10476 / NCIMB 786 / 157) TaxID=797303 RepID=L0JMC2_NATP1|nr:hypothetical protein [Natrinema pellirubrum]AGB31727.1 hypothetical protein Natpe_1860 [Natrinema pellirubrum DSM 15624]ELY72939.1 hypothetical protein C488_14712 [Natrinema pellirubrum DSM 15624]
MNDLTDPRPPLPEWIVDVYEVLCDSCFNPVDEEDVQSVPREQALTVLLTDTDLSLEPEDADHALTRLLERGYFYSVDGELRVTSSETHV